MFSFKIQFLFLVFVLSSCLDKYTCLEFLQNFISCISISSAWYLATYAYKIILKIFPSPEFSHFVKLFQAWRSTGSDDRTFSRPGQPTDPVDRDLCQDMHACACLSVDRPVDRPKTVCSLFFVGRPTGRPPLQNCVLPLEAGWPTGRPSPTAICQQGWRSTGLVDRQPAWAPTTLSSLVKFWNLFLRLFVWQIFLIFWGLILDHMNLIKSCFNPLLPYK